MDCWRCSLMRSAHDLPPLKALFWVSSDVMQKIPVCSDCAKEARALGLLLEAIPGVMTLGGEPDPDTKKPTVDLPSK